MPLSLLNIFSNKWLWIGLSAFATLYLVYYNISSTIKEKNQTISTLKMNNQQLNTLIHTLETNLVEQKLLCEEQKKTTSFNTIVQEKKEEVQTKIDEFKPKETKTNTKKEIKNEKPINNADSVFFNL